MSQRFEWDEGLKKKKKKDRKEIKVIFYKCKSREIRSIEWRGGGRNRREKLGGGKRAVVVGAENRRQT